MTARRRRDGDTGAAPRLPRRFLPARGALGVLVALLVLTRGFWEGGASQVASGLALLGWLASSSAAGALAARLRGSPAAVWGGLLFGDSLAAALAVRATGGVQGATVLLLALPALAGGLVLRRPMALLLGLAGALLYALLGFEELQAGAHPGLLWSEVILHSVLFCAFGLASGLVGLRVAVSLQEAARTRSEYEAYRLSTDRILASLTCGLVAVDPQGRVRAINPEAARLTAPSGSEAQRDDPRGVRPDAGGDVWSLFGESNPALLRLVEDHLRAESADSDSEITLRTREGRVFPAWIKVTGVHGEDGGCRGIVLLFWDLTARQREERRGRRQERLAAVGEMAAGLVHEIRNSLKPITGCIELLERRGHLAGAAAPMAAVILRESDSLSAFLSQFLTLARDKALKVEEIDLEELIREEIRSLSLGGDCSGRGARVDLGPRAVIWGDRDWLRQIVRNLLLNAFEAAACGTVRVRGERFLRNGAEAWYRLRVIDQGPGLGDLEPQEAFAPFRTTKARGTGLGLAIVQRAVHEHGGQVGFDTRHAGGACVVVELPVRPPAPRRATPGRRHERHEVGAA